MSSLISVRNYILLLIIQGDWHQECWCLAREEALGGEGRWGYDVMSNWAFSESGSGLFSVLGLSSILIMIIG